MPVATVDALAAETTTTLISMTNDANAGVNANDGTLSVDKGTTLISTAGMNDDQYCWYER